MMHNLTKNYLEKLGITKPLAPDLGALKVLHKAHTHTFAFENISPFLHEEVSLKEEDLFQKFFSGRGGYCFEQNALFAFVLRDLGFKVTGLGARVLWNQPEELITRRSHMLLLIDLEEGSFIADVGFGGLTLTTPLKFEVGKVQKTTHEDFRIETLGESFKMQAKIAESWKTLYRFDLIEHFPIDYEVVNFYLFSHPSSMFRNSLMAALADENGRHALNNNHYTFYSKNGAITRRELSGPEEIIEVLQTSFRIKLPMETRLKERMETLFIHKH